MIVSRKNNQLIDFNVKINEKTITRTTCVKYLGVFIDDKLTWFNHITTSVQRGALCHAPSSDPKNNKMYKQYSAVA